MTELPHGPCVVCGQLIGNAMWAAQQVVAAVGPEGSVLCCVHHLADDGPKGPKYLEAVRKMAEAKAEQLRRAK